MCKPCDAERVREYYAENREAVLDRQAKRRGDRRLPEPLECSECGVELEPPKRVVCSTRCREARFRRLNPDAYAGAGSGEP